MIGRDDEMDVTRRVEWSRLLMDVEYELVLASWVE